MVTNNKKPPDREMPRTHFILISTPIIFTVVWMLDSVIFNISTILNNFVPLIVQLIIFLILLVFALWLIYKSHKSLFDENQPSNTLITDDIFAHVRNPLYLGILLIYLALIMLSISLICIGLFVIISMIYNKMVNFEENVLEKIFGRDYLEYKKKVPKWIPK